MSLDMKNEASRQVYARACNSIINQKNDNKMDLKLITSHLGLQEEASNDKILDAIKSKETLLASAENTVKELGKKNAELNESLKEANETLLKASNRIKNYQKTEAEMFVNVLEKEGKFADSDHDFLVESYTKDPEGFKNLVGKIKTQVAKITDEITNRVADEKADWDFEKWSREDPEGLQKIKENQPEVFTALMEAHLA